MQRHLRVIKAMADENRLRILKILEANSQCVCELQEALGIVQSAVSRHLHILEDAGLITHERNGMWVDYSLVPLPSDTNARAILKAVLDGLENNPQTKNDRAKMASIRREEICSTKDPHSEKQRGGE